MIAGKDPLVTVVTVTYNSSRYLRDTIESVLSQTYRNIEYIIGDDCSKDSTWDIIGEYNDLRIRTYRNETNIGEYANRGKALDLVSGEYMVFIDGDDIVYEYGIETFVRMAIKFPEAGVLITKSYTNNVIFPYLMQPREVMMNYYFGNDLLQSSFVSNFFRTSVIKNISMPKEYIQGDQYLRLSVAIETPVLFMAGFLTWHRETPGQASSRISELAGIQESYRMSKRILEKIGFFDGDLKQYGVYLMESLFVKACFRNLLKLKISYTLKYWKMSGIKPGNVLRGFLRWNKYKVQYPTLLDHDPGNPAKYKRI